VTTVLLVGGDLMAKSRLVDATSRAGLGLESTTADGFLEAVRTTHPSLVVLDLDGGRNEALEALRAAHETERLPRVVGYYSHVDRALGEAAAAAGCEAWPRGRFWGSLEKLLQPDD
jgi:DNA-binding NarL/FixJ family response regulator